MLGRYAMYEQFAAGGMATLHYGRLLGPSGFSRTVAIKRLHAHLSEDPDFVAMFLDEARLAARIHHPNVIQTLDVESSEGELFVVLDYVHGDSLSRLLREARRLGEPATPDGLLGSVPGPTIGFDHLTGPRDRGLLARVDGVGHHAGDGTPSHAPIEKSGDGHLVGRVEDRGGRAPGRQGRPREP